MTSVMGRFALSLAWDRFSGQADSPGRVQYRAAQLRSVSAGSFTEVLAMQRPSCSMTHDAKGCSSACHMCCYAKLTVLYTQLSDMQ